MRWALAGTGLVLEAAVLALYFLPPLQRRFIPSRQRAIALLAWSPGALALSVFAILDHDITLLAGQILATALFVCLAGERGGGQA